MKTLSDLQVLITKHVDDLIANIDTLAQCHKRIADADNLLQEHAARKKAYVCMDIFEELISIFIETREDCWEAYVA